MTDRRLMLVVLILMALIACKLGGVTLGHGENFNGCCVKIEGFR
jgi:hypothetical protein